MPTVHLRCDTGSVALLHIDAFDDDTALAVATYATTLPVGSDPAAVAGELGGRLRHLGVGVELAARSNVKAAAFSTLTVLDDGHITDYALAEVCDSCGLLRREFRADVPRDPGGRWCKGAGCQGGAGGLSPASVAAHAARDEIGAKLAPHPNPDDARATVLSENVDPTGPASTLAEFDMIDGSNWTPERQAMHDAMIDEYLATPGVKSNHEALMTAGPPGAGKSGLIAKAGFDEEGFLKIDSDEIKMKLIERGHVRMVPGMTKGEHAGLLHEESDVIAKEIGRRAELRGMNITYDTTMGSDPNRKIDRLHDNGYTVRGAFAHVSTDESMASARIRWQEGGRFVPPAYIELTRRPNGSTANEENFIAGRPKFANWIMIDQTGIADRNPRGTVMARGENLDMNLRALGGSGGEATVFVVCGRCGLPRIGQFVAPRAADGKWCKGAQCQAGPHTTPGQRAAHTKQLQREAGASGRAQDAATGVSPAEKLRNGTPSPEELDAMEKVGGPLGSNGGGWYRDDNGQRYLVKPAQSEDHAHTELSAQMLYRELGVPVDDTGIHQRDGQWFITKRAIQDQDGSLGKVVGDGNMTPDLQSQARQGFHADALASSWDAFGLGGDNVLTGPDGTLHRIDVGGSLQYRAMGSDKPSFAPGRAWVEPTTLRTSNQGRQLYGTMGDRDAAASLSKLSGFDVAGFDNRLAASGINPQVRNRISSTLDDRISNQLPGILDRLRAGT